jgi:LacI family transcriptional regulator
VISNNFQGAYEGTLHLIQQGYKQIAQITSSDFLSITSERLAGYFKGLEENNMKINETFIKYCAHGGMIEEEIFNAINDVFALPIILNKSRLV